MNRSSLAVISLFSFFLIFTSISGAQLGEVAGQPHFNVSLGGTNSITITVVNQAAYALPVRVILPSLTTTAPNAITPRVTTSITDGFVPAGGNLRINITVYMPGGTNKPGYTWTGVMQVVTVPNSSVSGGGAQILEGVAKIITITATAHVSSLWDYLPVAIVAVVAVVAVVVVAVLFKKGIIGKKTGAARAAEPAARKAQSRKAARGRKRKGRKAAALRSASRRGKGKARKGRGAARKRKRGA